MNLCRYVRSSQFFVVKIVDEAVMKIMCSPSFIQVLDKISCNTDNTGGLLAGAQDDFATTLNGAYTKRPHEWKSTIEILASDNFPKIIWNQYKKQLELSSSEPSNLFLSEEARCDNLIDRLQFIRYTLSQVSSQDLANHYGIHNYVKGYIAKIRFVIFLFR